jgi:hypothetical protein
MRARPELRVGASWLNNDHFDPGLNLGRPLASAYAFFAPNIEAGTIRNSLVGVGFSLSALTASGCPFPNGVEVAVETGSDPTVFLLLAIGL